MKNSNQLKALIRNFSKENNVSAQVLLRNYMHERFLSCSVEVEEENYR